jgi:Gluconate 2-dehydrogenase subunit 3
MNRREILQRLSLVIGGTLLGADQMLAKNIDWDALENAPESKGIGLFNKSQIRLLNEVADTIIPTTDTPGAKAAKVGQFMAVIVSDCYTPEDQKIFVDGLVQLQERCKKEKGKSFVKCAPAERLAFLNTLDAEQKAYYKSKKPSDPPLYFRQMKDLALWGYFTSEIGSTQALRYLQLPGRYETIDYKKGDRAWAG